MNLKKLLTKPNLTGLISSCLIGKKITYKAEDNKNKSCLDFINTSNRIKFLDFCPENSSLSTPRDPMNIINGDGNDVLEGKSFITNHQGINRTDEMLLAAQNTLDFVLKNKIDFCILKEGSPSCASTWIYKGEAWPTKEKRSGLGLTTALLKKNNIPVFSEFDINFLSQALHRYKVNLL